MKKTKIGAMIMALAMASAVALPIVNAGNLSFSSESDTLIKGCPVQIDLNIDTQWEEVNSVDLGIMMNDGFTFNSFDIDDGVFRTYSNPKQAVARKGDFKGRNYLRVLATTASPNGYNGEGKLSSITITPTADEITLEFYAIPGHDWDDTNLMVMGEDKVVKDVLKEAQSKTFKVVEGECLVSALEEINLEEVEFTVSAEEVEDLVIDTTDVNEENVFDKTQIKTWVEINWMYLSGAALLLIIIIIIASRKKRKK